MVSDIIVIYIHPFFFFFFLIITAATNKWEQFVLKQDQLCSVERDVCPILFTLLIHVPITLYSAGYRNVS